MARRPRALLLLLLFFCWLDARSFGWLLLPERSAEFYSSVYELTASNDHSDGNYRLSDGRVTLLGRVSDEELKTIKTLADLKGKRIPAGFSAQVTLDRIIDAVLANGGVERRDIKPVLVPNVVRGADDFIEGKIDGGFFALGAAKVLETHKSVGGIRYLPLSDDPQAIARMKKHMNYAYVTDVKPGPAFAGVDAGTMLKELFAEGTLGRVAKRPQRARHVKAVGHEDQLLHALLAQQALATEQHVAVKKGFGQ